MLRIRLWGFHVFAGAWIAAMLWLGTAAPERYRALLQEDRAVEWGTVWLFLCAGVVGLHAAVTRRRVFDGLVALFCLFVAGEEFSWGQRLFGYFPPEYFLRHNEQQELSVHNLPQSVQPGSILMLALAGHGLLIPLLARWRLVSRLVDRAGATPPAAALVLWYGAAIALMWWYPFTLTGEWVELLAGAVFLTWAAPRPSLAVPLLASAAAFGLAMTALSSRLDRGRDADRLACAAAETGALAGDIAAGQAGTPDLWRMRRVHKRLFSSIGDGFLVPEGLQQFRAAVCAPGDEKQTEMRRRFGLDPWGSPYWLEVERDAQGSRVTVYSFGPNRRRDIASATPDDGDDVSSTGTRQAPVSK